MIYLWVVWALPPFPHCDAASRQPCTRRLIFVFVFLFPSAFRFHPLVSALQASRVKPSRIFSPLRDVEGGTESCEMQKKKKKSWRGKHFTLWLFSTTSSVTVSWVCSVTVVPHKHQTLSYHITDLPTGKQTASCINKYTVYYQFQWFPFPTEPPFCSHSNRLVL